MNEVFAKQRGKQVRGLNESTLGVDDVYSVPQCSCFGGILELSRTMNIAIFVI